MRLIVEAMRGLKSYRGSESVFRVGESVSPGHESLCRGRESASPGRESSCRGQEKA